MKVIVLCGSVSLKEHFIKVHHDEYNNGNIAIMPCYFTKSDGLKPPTTQQLKFLIEHHLDLIDTCDEVIIIRKDNVLGRHTKHELQYAISKNKPVQYYDI